MIDIRYFGGILLKVVSYVDINNFVNKNLI